MTIEQSEHSEEFKKGFSAGAKAIFDAIHFRAANNYHGRPAMQALCDKENSLVISWINDALEEVSPEDMATWRSIDDAFKTGYETGKRDGKRD